MALVDEPILAVPSPPALDVARVTVLPVTVPADCEIDPEPSVVMVTLLEPVTFAASETLPFDPGEVVNIAIVEANAPLTVVLPVATNVNVLPLDAPRLVDPLSV